MAKGKLTSMVISDLEKLNKKLAKEIAPEINKLFKESVSYSLIDWYNSYDPSLYKRTNNFLSIYNTANTSSNGNILTMKVDSSSMHDYPGFEIPPYPTYEQQSLSSSSAFDMFFMNGEHGHGRWLMETSLPPFLYVDEDVYSGFGGRAQKIIANKIQQLL